MPSQVLSICRDRDSATSLGSLHQCLIPFTLFLSLFFFLNKVFPYFTCNLIYFKLCPSPLVLMLCTTKEFNSIFFAPPVKYWFTLLRLIWVSSSMKSKSFFRLYLYIRCSEMLLSSWLDLLQVNEPLQYFLLWDTRMSDLELTRMLNIKHVPNYDS